MKKNKKANFLFWYYEKSLHEFLEIWKNFLRFAWQHFSIAELSMTLVAPWRRDVSAKNWRGWHPKRALGLFAGNITSRFIGAVVRLAVISAGIAFFSGVFLIGIFLLLFWLVFPIILAVFIYKVVFGSALFTGMAGFVMFYLAIVVCAYFVDSKVPYREMGFNLLYKEKFFERICNRLGTTKKALSRNVFKNSQALEEFLKERNISLDDFAFIVDWETGLMEQQRAKKAFWRWENLRKINRIGAQWKYAYTVKLDNYATDLSISDPTEYRDKDLNGREDEVELLKLILQRPDQNCAVIVGGSGIGKSTLVHYLAKQIRLNESESYFKNKRIMVLDMGRVISDAISKGGDAEGEIRNLFSEAVYAGNIILVIEHFEQYLGKDSSAFHPDIAPVLSEFLSHPNFQLVATSSPKEYHQLIEKHDQIVKYFEVIEMREPSEQDTVEILYANLRPHETTGVIFTHEAIKAVIKESNRYNWSSPLPERAIDLAMDVMMLWNKKPDAFLVNEQTVSEFLSLKTGTPHGEIQSGERKKLLNLEKILHQQVIGQEEAIKQVAEALRRARSGISNMEKPVGSFLFLGPTGVGKTETAKALAKTYFGDEGRMIRFDMSEFQTPSSIDRLLGSSQLNQQGRLVTEVKDNPYSLILLDEIEKAYPEILDIFLQILDEGFVTDAFGEKVNFRNTMIIATSNAGAALIKEEVEMGADADKIKQDVIDYAISNNVFRVEFLNRFDGVIFFRPLSGNELTNVVKLMLKKLAKRLHDEKNIDVDFSDDLSAKIIEKGYNPIFGARSLNRYIEDTVEDILAKKIIAGEVRKGEKVRIGL